MKLRTRVAPALGLALSLLGCNGRGDGNAGPPPPPCVPPTVEIDPSIVVHDPSLLAPHFPLRKTLEALVASSGVSGSPEALLQTLLDSFQASGFANAAGQVVPVDPRPGEAALAVAALLDPASPDGLVPTGLFNRFDLAPQGGATCGEYRITYAKRPGGTPGRFLLIFEAVLPNPEPKAGLAGCAPVTDFWTSLSAVPGPAERAERLSRFFYEGLGGGVPPVVRYAHYGVPLGQVRSNLFIQGLEWRLREHRTDPVRRPAFLPDSVKENPMPELGRALSELPPGFTAADQEAFRSHFLMQPLCTLTSPDRDRPGASTFEVVNGIGGGFLDAADDFESVSQGTRDDPLAQLDPGYRGRIAGRLAELDLDALTPEHVLRRTGAMMCGGCHEFSNGADLGGGHRWPESARFVHIAEDGTLSRALNEFFLPRRQAILRDFACDRSPAAPPLSCPGAPVPPEALATGAEPLAPLLEAVAAAEAAYRQQLRSAAPEGPVPADAGGGELTRLVERARAAERQLPGAFVPVRRVH